MTEEEKRETRRVLQRANRLLIKGTTRSHWLLAYQLIASFRLPLFSSDPDAAQFRPAKRIALERAADLVIRGY